jgi:hypothetical protein
VVVGFEQHRDCHDRRHVLRAVELAHGVVDDDRDAGLEAAALSLDDVHMSTLRKAKCEPIAPAGHIVNSQTLAGGSPHETRRRPRVTMFPFDATGGRGRDCDAHEHLASLGYG